MKRKKLLIDDKYSINIGACGKEYNVLEFSEVLTSVVKELCNKHNIKPEDISVSVEELTNSEGIFNLHFLRYETDKELLKRIQRDNYARNNQIECMKHLINMYRDDAMEYLLNNIVNDSKD